jgi:NitT/TauT family transport system substrate-binding protein
MIPGTVGRLGAGVAVALLAAAACGQGIPSPSASAPASASPAPAGSGALPGPLLDGVTVRFGVFPNVTHAPGLVELAPDGTLSKLLPNAVIDVKAFNSGTEAVEAMFSNALDITFVGPNPAINAFAQSHGQAVRIISGSTSGGAFLVVRPDIASAADLRGRKIASPSLGNTQDVALRAWLRSQGFSTDTAGGGDVSVVPQDNAQTLETFVAGTIDGAWLPEPWATRLIQDAGAKVLVDERDLWPNGHYVTTHLMVGTTFLDAHPDVVQRILLATIQAVDLCNDHPADAQVIVNTEILRWTSKALGEPLLAGAWGNLTFTVDPIASSLQKSAADAEALGLLDDPGDLAGLYDLGPLDALLRTLGRPEVSGL